jgi:hypothetical protein
MIYNYCHGHDNNCKLAAKGSLNEKATSHHFTNRALANWAPKHKPSLNE